MTKKNMKNAAEIVKALQNKYTADVILGYHINPLVSVETRKEVGYGITINLNGKNEYDDSVLNDWKTKFDAEECSIKVTRNQLVVIYRVYTKK